MMKNNQKRKENSGDIKKRVMVIHSDDKNWNASDYYPMQNWSVEDRQLWGKIMLEKKKLDS
jgi:hypothetical protein